MARFVSHPAGLSSILDTPGAFWCAGVLICKSCSFSFADAELAEARRPRGRDALGRERMMEAPWIPIAVSWVAAGRMWE